MMEVVEGYYTRSELRETRMGSDASLARAGWLRVAGESKGGRRRLNAREPATRATCGEVFSSIKDNY
jgi:hypothetical protein